ncbi:MAG: methionyl-tRNA formyltransferase [Acholeplasmatales bacterium]|nr:methionyl-tRNA formyltransferase [Acholeplasmatales bacterium]
MKIVFMGTIEFSVRILDYLFHKYGVELVISQPNRLKKKNELLPTEVAKYAADNNIRLLQPEKIGDIYEDIKAIEPDILVTAAYGQFIPTKILNLFKKQINVHASILPKYRGGAPIQRSIMNGDKKTGVSIMRMVKGMDAGEVYLCKELEILPEDNNTSLFKKLADVGVEALDECFMDIVEGRNLGVPQNEEEVTYAYNIAPEEEIISFNEEAQSIVNKIKGLSLEPGAHFEFKGIKIKVFDASVVEDDSNAKPGSVLNIKKQILIKAKDKAVSLDLILLPGKKMLSGKDFSNGQKVFSIGDIIE